MQETRRGPQFERPESQRVVIGAYEPAPRRELATPDAGVARKPTLLEKLRARFRGEKVTDERGPGFQQPQGTQRLGRYKGRRRNRSADLPRHRPTGFKPND